MLPNRDGSQEQAAVRTSTHILLGLVFCSGTVLGQVKQVKLPAVPPSKGMKHLSGTLYSVCAEDLIAQQGRVAASVPFQPSEEHTPAGKAGGYPHQPKSKPVVVIQL